MKKSKFLKKSLAMLLALMLVVAMIPLSASAATPVMRQVDVTAGGQNVQLVDGEGANTLVGEISNLSQNIVLTVLAGTDNSVYYTDKSASANSDALAWDNHDGTWTIDIRAANVDDYENADGDVEINFSVADEAKPATRLTFTVLLTPVDVSTDTTIERFTINNVYDQNVQLGETVIGVEDIYFTVPYDAAGIDDAEFRIRELKLASATATVRFGRPNGTPNGTLDYYYTTEAATDKIVTDGNPSITIRNGDIMEITNNNNVHTYTLHITPAAGFTSFATEEGLDAVRFADSGDIVVLLPYGYSSNGGNITVTPVFDLDYEKAEATWTSGESITVPASNVMVADSGNEQTFVTYLEDADGPTRQSSWTYRKEHLSGSFTQFVRATPPTANASQVTITYSENASRTYNVYFYEPYFNQDAEITELTIGSETATIDQENKTIDITVPMGTDVSDLNLNGDTHVEVGMTASNGAEVTIPMQNITFTESTARRIRYAEDFTTNSEIDATNPVQIRVVSEDRLTENFYTLNVEVANEFVKPALTDMSLRSPDGTNYDGEITTDKGINVIKFSVPYEVYDNTRLAGWNLFYTKTVGSTITFDSNGAAAGGATTAMPKSGAELTGNEVYLPQIDGQTRAAVALDLHVSGDELSAMATSYYIEIVRENGKQESTLSEFALYGVPDFTAANPDLDSTANVGSRFEYAGVIDQAEQTISVDVPWSVYAQWKLDDYFNAIAEAVEDSNALIYFQAANGNYVPLNNVGTTSPTEVVKATTTTSNWRLYDGAQILVLSEQMWVDMTEDNQFVTAANGQNVIRAATWTAISNNQDNKGLYTIYDLDIAQAEANSGNELKDVRLVDGTGWTAPLSINTKSGSGYIEGEIPYALTSDLHDPKTWNPVFLEYNTSPYAFVLGVDNVGATEPAYTPYATNPAGGTYNVPTAGNNRNGVFIDIADYLEKYDNNYDLAIDAYYTDGNPFFLIDRDGNVHVYNCTNPHATPILAAGDITLNSVAMNYLAVSAEDGSPYQQYQFHLDVAAANQGTEVSSFYFEEYPSRRGVIDNTAKTITVTLPYGTEYTYLTPNFEVSTGAIVTIDDPELQGKPLFPGYTDVNFSTSRKMTVIAENESDSTEYTIRVEIEAQFSDVKPSDWFYGNVMDAAANGYVSGMGDGTFNPKGATTRAQFAAMIANAMGYEADNSVDPAFKDVQAGSWANGAIAFCAERGIISGYDDGTFKPDQTISRQEAASILKNAFNLTGNSGDLFPDDSAIAGWAKENVYAVKHSGLMKGDAGTGMFRPTSTITRAEAASIFMNANSAGLIK